MSDGTYLKPDHGWTCFHCGETFTSPGAARDHFGADPSATPGCMIRVKTGQERGLLMELRKAEAKLARYYAEDSDTDRAMARMTSDHAQALIREEEKGYARGIADMRNELLNTPELRNFADGAVLEAQHQRERWGSDHDTGKAPADWFWLIGYLAQKAMMSQLAGEIDKALHHAITTAAAMANWHAQMSGASNHMRPGIEPPASGA